MSELDYRIVINPEQRVRVPCIRETHIQVSEVLDLLANGLSVEEILEQMPDLEREDVYASLRFASQSLEHPMVAAHGMWKDRTDLPDFAEMRREMDRFSREEEL